MIIAIHWETSLANLLQAFSTRIQTIGLSPVVRCSMGFLAEPRLLREAVEPTAYEPQ